MPESASRGGVSGREGGVSGPGGGVPGLGGVPGPGGGVSGPGGVCAWSGGGLPQCLVGCQPPRIRHTTPPVNRMTNRCKNITLATTSLRPVTSLESFRRYVAIIINTCPWYVQFSYPHSPPDMSCSTTGISVNCQMLKPEIKNIQDSGTSLPETNIRHTLCIVSTGSPFAKMSPA